MDNETRIKILNELADFFKEKNLDMVDAANICTDMHISLAISIQIPKDLFKKTLDAVYNDYCLFFDPRNIEE